MMQELVKCIFVLCVTALLLSSWASGQQTKSTSSLSCPQFKIASSAPSVKAGLIVEFEIVSNDQNILAGKFNWTLSRGKIVSGQGTSRIKVLAWSQPNNETPLAASSSDKSIPPGFIPSPYPQSILIGGSLMPRSVQLVASASMSGASLSNCPSASITIQINRTEEVINQPANVTRLTLSSDRLVTPCRPGIKPREGSATSMSMIIGVTVDAVDPENDVLNYNYEVSGGRIEGSGANVKWDLTGAAAGRYTITAAVDDGCGLCDASKTLEITIGECELACSLIDCPSISIIGPDRLTDTSEFTANVSGGSVSEVTYEWTVTNGVLVYGQGTSIVKAKLEPTSSITVKIGGLEGGGCIRSISKEFSGGIVKP